VPAAALCRYLRSVGTWRSGHQAASLASTNLEEEDDDDEEEELSIRCVGNDLAKSRYSVTVLRFKGLEGEAMIRCAMFQLQNECLLY